MRFTGNGKLYNYGDIIRLPEHARVLVVSDIHGNYDDFMYYVNLWETLGGEDDHLMFLGDLIHGLDSKTDKSLEILDEVRSLIEKPNFHVLMGNHEWYQINDIPIFKNGINQTREFKNRCKKKGPLVLDFYKDIMAEFQKVAICPNGLVMAHAGPHRRMNSILKDMKGLVLSPIFHQNEINEAFEIMVFARPNDYLGYSEKDIEDFLDAVDGKAMVVGHTPVGGYYVFGKQVIMDSSFGTNNKYYLSMQTDEEINSIDDVVKNLVKVD